MPCSSSCNSPAPKDILFCMITLLCKIFIKDCNNTQDLAVRKRYGELCGIVGIGLNLFLFAGKLVAGLFSHSVSVIADALNNLSDSAASIVTIIGFKASAKKPDAAHPFGHGRIEYIAALIVSFFILTMGWELFKSSLDSIRSNTPLDASLFTIITLIVSIFIKLYMFIYNSRIGKKIKSKAMEATSKDSLCDMVSTMVVLACILTTMLVPTIKIPLDGIAGILVSLFIFYNGINSILDTINPLLGSKADPEFVSKIEKEAMKHTPIRGIHDLIVHDYGPGRTMISLHAEVPGDRNIFDLHEAIDNAEVAISKKFNCDITIHLDPIDVSNPETSSLKTIVSDFAKTLDKNITIHDLRIVPGKEHTNVIFDAVHPYSCTMSREELSNALVQRIKDYNPTYNAIVHIDEPFF